MSISSTVRKAGPYSGNGSTTQFPFSFKVFSASDVLVVRTDSAGVESNLVLGTDYTVALNADQDANPGGTITTTTAPATGYLITITSQVQNLQPVTLTNQGAFYPKVINDALDRAAIQIQQLAEQVSRAVKVQISSSVSPDALISQLETDVANAAASASAASSIAAAAGAKLAEFKGVYYGPYASNPAVDPNGNPPDAGDAYYNTVTGLLMVFDGATWAPAIQHAVLADNATNLTGTSTANIPTSALGSGTADSTKFLRGDRTWVAPPTPTTASTAEAQAGTDNTKMITPLRVRDAFNASGSAPVYACRAWVCFDGKTVSPTILASGNVSSMTKNGTGDYTLNFTSSLPDDNYSLAGFSVSYSTTNVAGAAAVVLYPSGTATYTPGLKTTSSVRFLVGSSYSGNLTDSGNISLTVFR
jgi:hypothetical protein